MAVRRGVARSLRAAIAANGARHADLAAAVRRSLSWVGRVTAGKRPMTVEELVIMARLLGVPAADFLPDINREGR